MVINNPYNGKKKMNQHIKQLDWDIYLLIKVMKLLQNIFIFLLFEGQ